MAVAPGTTGIHSTSLQLLEFSGVFRGRELTRKDRRLGSNLVPLNDLLGGGIPRGRISEIVGPQSSGKTSIAASFIAAATRRGETVAVVDLENAFDPLTMAAAGVDLNRVLWAAAFQARRAEAPQAWNTVKAGELILEAGGFGLMVLDFGGYARSIPQSAALRLARLAERSGTSVLMLALHRMCGTFAALGLSLKCNRTLFTRFGIHGPAILDGLRIEAILTRNKLGGSGGRGHWRTLIDPSIAPVPSSPNRKARSSG